MTNGLFSGMTYVPKAIQWLGMITGVAYVVGFLIETLYLGTQGFFVTDLLRAQYVFSGLVFIGFVSIPVAVSVTTVSDGLERLSRLDHRGRVWRPLYIVPSIGFSLLGFGGLFPAFILSLLPKAANRVDTFPGPTTQATGTQLSWATLYEIVLDRTVLSTTVAISIAVLLVTLSKTWGSWRYVLRTAAQRRPFLTRATGILVVLFTVVFASVVTVETAIFVSVFSLVFKAFLDVGSSSSSNPYLMSYGSAVSLAITLGASFLTFMWHTVKKDSGKDERPAPDAESPKARLAKSLTWAVVYLLGPLLTIMWTYAGFVFPLLPRAVGGGQPEAIELVVKDEKLQTELRDPAHRTFLVHQGPNYMLLQIRRESNVVLRLFMPMTEVRYYRVDSDTLVQRVHTLPDSSVD